jgi:hypothetical protein
MVGFSVKNPKGSPPNVIPVLERVLWGPKGKSANQPTNFYFIIKILNSLDSTLFAKQKASINRRLYESKLVTDINFL